MNDPEAINYTGVGAESRGEGEVCGHKDHLCVCARVCAECTVTEEQSSQGSEVKG